MNKKKKSADTISIGGFCIRCIKEGLTENGCFLIVLRVFFNKKTARSFFAEVYRSVNAAGDSCKATLWHTRTFA